MYKAYIPAMLYVTMKHCISVCAFLGTAYILGVLTACVDVRGTSVRARIHSCLLYGIYSSPVLDLYAQAYFIHQHERVSPERSAVVIGCVAAKSAVDDHQCVVIGALYIVCRRH